MLLLALLACSPELEASCAASPVLGVGARLVDLGTLGPDEGAMATLGLHNSGLAPAELSFQLWFGSTWDAVSGPTGFTLTEPGPVIIEPGEERDLVLELRPAWEGPLWDVLVVEAVGPLTREPAGSSTVLLRGHGQGTGLVQAPAPAWLGRPHATPDRLLPGEPTTVESCWYDPEAEVGAPVLFMDGQVLDEPDGTWLSGGVRCWSWGWSAPAAGEYSGNLDARWQGHQLVDYVEISAVDPEC